MLTNRYENEGGAYHFAIEDMLDFVDKYGWDTILGDLMQAYERRSFLRRMEERKHMEFGAHYE